MLKHRCWVKNDIQFTTSKLILFPHEWCIIIFFIFKLCNQFCQRKSEIKKILNSEENSKLYAILDKIIISLPSNCVSFLYMTFDWKRTCMSYFSNLNDLTTGHCTSQLNVLNEVKLCPIYLVLEIKSEYDRFKVKFDYHTKFC